MEVLYVISVVLMLISNIAMKNDRYGFALIFALAAFPATFYTFATRDPTVVINTATTTAAVAILATLFATFFTFAILDKEDGGKIPYWVSISIYYITFTIAYLGYFGI